MTSANRPLIGRTQELELLGDALDAAAAGIATFLLVVGEAGIGKSRLLRATEALCHGVGLRSLAGSAIESGRAIPYLPLVAPLTAAIGEDGGPATDIVRRALSGGLREPRGMGDDSGPGLDNARLVEAIFEVLVARPTVLLVDDVHWADESTVAVLDYLAHRATDVPLAVICTARDDERDLVTRLPIADGRRFAQLAPGRLSREEVEEQARGIIGDGIGDVRLDALYRRTGGNPMFVEQLLAADPDMTGTTRSTATPAALRALVHRRTGYLTGAARQVVDALAVLGRPVDLELLGAVAGLDQDEVRRALAAAVNVGIAAAAPAGFTFRHPLFGEVVVAGMPDPSRAALHRRAAEQVELRGGEVAEIAGHWWRAGDRDRTWSTSLAAAEAAHQAYAFAEQHLHLARALEVWPPGVAGRGPLLLEAARAAWQSGDPEVAVRLAETATTSDAPLVEALVALGAYGWDAGDRPASIAAFERVAPLLEGIASPELRSRALWGLGRGRVVERPHESVELAIAAADQAALAGDLVQQSESLTLAAMSRAWAGSLEGIPELERALEIALAARATYSTGHAYQFLVELLALSGETERALNLAVRGIEDCERLGLARFHGSDLRGRAALLLIDTGRWNDAEALLGRADPRALPALARALLAIRRGDATDQIDDALVGAATLGAIGGPGIRGGPLEAARIERAWLAGDVPMAGREFASFPPAPGVWAFEADLLRARWAARLAGVVDTPVVVARTGAHPHGALARAVRAEIVAEETERSSPRGSADVAGAWTWAADGWESLGRPYDAAWARLREAEARFAARDRSAAREALHRAAARADELGSRPLLGRAESIAHRARVAPLPIRRHRPDPSELSARERDVLGLMAEGLTNPQIAERLFLSPKTVGIHVSRILGKFGAHTRGEAVARARRRGLVA